MKGLLWLVLGGCVLLGVASVKATIDYDVPIRRGDANHDGIVSVSDASYITNWLFHGGAEPPCVDAADANDDGIVSVSDAGYITNWLFQGGPTPPAPGPHGCGVDPTSDTLTCEASCY